MEVDQSEGGRVYTKQTSASGSVTVSLHPLVIMNISDHFTRVRMQNEEASPPGEGVGSLWSSQATVLRRLYPFNTHTTYQLRLSGVTSIVELFNFNS